MATAPVTSIVERIAAAGKAYEGEERGSREALMDLGRDLVAALEIPSEFLQRSFWAEVCVYRSCCGQRAYPAIASLVCPLQACGGRETIPTPHRCWKVWTHPF